MGKKTHDRTSKQKKMYTCILFQRHLLLFIKLKLIAPILNE